LLTYSVVLATVYLPWIGGANRRKSALAQSS
jgi:hypothetical protein